MPVERPGLVVAFDTASENVALAVGQRTEGGGIILLASHDYPAVRQANVRLMPSIDALFATHGLSKEDVVCVVCGLGPGSFTGVRIGVATAKGMARGLRVPLFGVSTLDAVAWGAWLAGVRGSVGVVADAMRGEVYPARFTLDDAGATRLDPHTVVKAGEAAARWRSAGEHMLLIGDGLRKYAAEFSAEPAAEPAAELAAGYATEPTTELAAGYAAEPATERIGDATLWVPTGAGLLRAFEAACYQGTEGNGDAGLLLPIYTRLSDAEENERKRLATGGPIAQGALVDVPLSGVADPARLEAVIYRPMATEDLDQVCTLEQEGFPAATELSGERWTRGMFADELARGDRAWWVACVGDLLVGFAGGWVVDGVLQVLDVVVAAPRRRRGIGSELLHRLVQDGFALGATAVNLEVRESNDGARAFYAALGFERLGIRPNYYPPHAGEASKKREPAVIMTAPSPVPPANPAPPATPVILAIETSCDETAAAIIDGEGRPLAELVASQIDFHARFGGVVPEIASRKHTETIVDVVDATLEKAGLADWQELDALAVTYAPGLIGALVVGVAFAKGLSWATGLPLIRVNHLEGHIYANRLAAPSPAPCPSVSLRGAPSSNTPPAAPRASAPTPPHASAPPAPPPAPAPLAPPFIVALLSGGHTMLVHVRDWGSYRVLGQTLDDAVGEAFDKVAKALGLGYPGGPVISRLAEQGDPQAIDFPRALLNSHDYRFSLSGLKTAVITFIRKERDVGRELRLPDIAASFQQAVIDVQVAKALTALEETGCATFCIGGGVAANKALRDAYEAAMSARGIRVVFPPHHACTDNAVMIARVALDRFHAGHFMDLDGDACAQTDIESAY